ncbi:MAG: hypothetical protein R3258_07450 [Acidimicrobiia bacterium]|nr:hypothetical protein [Acidimicrobiia bacterium]
MSDIFEREIRELFEELDRAAPGPPPMPRRPAPSPRNWTRLLAPAGAAAAVLLVIGVASQFLLGEAGEADDASATTAVAAETTAAPAATTAADSEALGDLNQACSAFIDESSQAVVTPPTTEEEHIAALQSLVPVYSALNESVDMADEAIADPAFGQIARDSADLLGLVTAGATGPLEEAAATYQTAVQKTAGLGEELSTYGAAECAGLSSRLYP